MTFEGIEQVIVTPAKSHEVRIDLVSEIRLTAGPLFTIQACEPGSRRDWLSAASNMV